MSSIESTEPSKSPGGTPTHTRAKSLGELSSVIPGQVIDPDSRMHTANHSTPLLPLKKQNGGLTIKRVNSLDNLETNRPCSEENIDVGSSRQLQVATPSSVDDDEVGTRSGSTSERSEALAFSTQGNATKTNWLSHLLRGKSKDLQLEVDDAAAGKPRSQSVVIIKSKECLDNGMTTQNSTRRISYEESQ